MVKEIWRYIQGYEYIYEVSNYGVVRSLDREVLQNNGVKINLKGKILKLSLNYKGYPEVGLTKNGIRKTFRVHRLVAMAFHENAENKCCVNHIDGNKKNNSSENLEWVTNQENIDHAHKTGLFPETKKLPSHSKEIEMLDLEGNILKIFPSIAKASKEMKISKAAIHHCLNGKRCRNKDGLVLCQEIKSINNLVFKYTNKSVTIDGDKIEVNW